MSASLPANAGGTALVINSHARLGRKAEAAVVSALKRRGVRPIAAVRVGRPSKIGRLVEGWLRAAKPPERIIVGGGDGTLGTVAARLAGRPTAMGVLPLGTANDFARTLGIPADPDAAAAIASGDHVAPIDLARANGIPFLNVASVGMSAEVARELSFSADLKRWLGPSAYAVAGARAFLRHPTFRARLTWPDGASESAVHQVVVANGRFYGGGVLVALDSTLDDGKLTAYTLGTRSRWELLRTVTLLKFQIPLDRPGDSFVQTHSLRVDAWPPRPVNLDGEIRTRTPVEFDVMPGALRVLVPAG